jgi:hypothetical protein
MRNLHQYFDVQYLWYQGKTATPLQVSDLAPLDSNDCVLLKYIPSWIQTDLAKIQKLPLVFEAKLWPIAVSDGVV